MIIRACSPFSNLFHYYLILTILSVSSSALQTVSISSIISMQRFLLMRMPVPAEMISSRLGLPEYLTDVACSPLVPSGE